MDGLGRYITRDQTKEREWAAQRTSDSVHLIIFRSSSRDIKISGDQDPENVLMQNEHSIMTPHHPKLESHHGAGEFSCVCVEGPKRRRHLPVFRLTPCSPVWDLVERRERLRLGDG